MILRYKEGGNLFHSPFADVYEFLCLKSEKSTIHKDCGIDIAQCFVYVDDVIWHPANQ